MESCLASLMIHFGIAQPYLAHTVGAARRVFPGFVLLVDHSAFQNRHLCSYHAYASEDVDDFVRHYQHCSTNLYEYELFCFVRWFYIRNYALAIKASHVLHFDTDVVVCSEGQTLKHLFAGQDLCLAGRSGHTGWFSLATLERLCGFLVYFAREGYKRHVPAFLEAVRLKQMHAISDMTALHDFYESHSGPKKRYIPGISINLAQEDGFVKHPKNALPSIFAKQGRVYLQKRDSGEYIPFHTLHFQGATKKYIELFCEFLQREQQEPSQDYHLFKGW